MQSSSYARIQGFTLIELMIVVMIIGILAAIALPNYRQYYTRNAQEQAKSEMLSIANQLASWRSKRLSYLGFIPMNMCGTPPTAGNCYSNTDSKQVYIPIGSTTNDYRYLITLGDASTSSSIGNGWRMKAEPNPSNSLVNGSDTYYYDSTGQRCAYKTAAASTLDLGGTTVSCSGVGITNW